MRDEVKKVSEDLKHCIHEREYYKHYYQKCCGLRHGANLPLNLEMINNNHDFEYKRQDLKLGHPPVSVCARERERGGSQTQRETECVCV